MGQTAALFLNAGATATGALTQNAQAGAVARRGAYEQAVAEQNAAVADAQAADAIARGDYAATQSRLDTGRAVSGARTSYAGQGVDIASGAPEAVLEDFARMGELDALMLKNNAAREAYGFKVQAVTDRAGGKLARVAADNEASGLRAGAVSTLLTGAANTYGLYRQFNPQTAKTRTTTTKVPNADVQAWPGIRK